MPLRAISLEVPSVSWADVGGLEEIKERLKESVLWPQERAQDLSAMGVTVRLATPSLNNSMEGEDIFGTHTKDLLDENGIFKFVTIVGSCMVFLEFKEKHKCCYKLFN